MASNGDVLEVVVTGELYGQQIQNRYHYRVDNIVGAGTTEFINQALRSIFIGDVQDEIEDFTDEEVSFTQVEVKNLNDVTGDVVTAETRQGSSSTVGPAAPSLLAFSIQLRPASKDIRWGRKSFAGVSIGGLNGNDLTAPQAAQIALAIPALVAQLAHPNADFTPVIARIAPASLRPYVPFAVPIAEAVIRGLGTMYSRKPGRGA